MAEGVVHKVNQGLTAERVSFKENGFLGPFDLYAEDEAPLVWSQAMIDEESTAATQELTV